ncbi:MAG TPA: DUF6148 family protein [Thermohalobaculum sp.]|nr:DUF6148 family protein [Thermohalobaculum sp.]
MAGITKAQAEAQLALWLAADSAVAANQSYTIQGEGSSRTLTRADAKEIRENLQFWDAKAKELDRKSASRVRLGTPVAI